MMLIKPLIPVDLNWPGRAVAAGGMVLTALLVREGLAPGQDGLPFLTFYPALAAAFLCFGSATGWMVAALSVVMVGLQNGSVLAGSPGNRMALTLSLIFLATAALLALVTRELQARSLAVVRHAEALRISEQRLRDTIEEQTDALCRLDPDGTVNFVNTAFCRMMDATRDELLGKPWQPRIHSDDRARRDTALAALGRGPGQQEELVTLELRLLDQHGSARWWHFVHRALFDAAGNLRDIQVVGRDLTASRAQMADREALALELEALYNHAPCGYHSLDTNGRYVRINDTELAWLDCSREELIGKRSPRDFMTRPSQAIFDAHFPGILDDHPVHQLEVELISRRGTRRWVSVNSRVHRGPDGTILHTCTALFDITARKGFDEHLRQLSREQRAVLDSGLFGACRVIDRRMTWVNSGLETMLGYARGELVGMHVEQLYPNPAACAAFGATAYALLQSGMPHRAEVLLVRKEGRQIWLDVNGQLCNPATGEVLWLAFDISDRKRLEDRVLHSATEISDLYQHAPCGYHSLDAGGVFTRINQTTLDWLGCREEEVVNRLSPFDFLTEDGQEVFRTQFPRLLRDGVLAGVELELVSRSGARRWVSYSATVARDARGRFLCTRSVLFDISERRAIEQQLAAAHELQRVTLDSIGDAVITTDRDGHVEWLNPVAEQLTGWLKGEARGRPVQQVFHIVHEGTRQPAVDPVTRCLASNETVALTGNTLLLSRNGSEYGIEDSAAPIRNERKEVLGVVLVFHDVSEARRLNEEMRHRATHDPLTGLVNRGEFEIRVTRLLARAQEDGSTHGLLYLDLDQFKLINDACGHTVGDQLLRQFANLLKDCVRGRDTVARLGGDEFGVLLEHCDMDHAQGIGRKVCGLMEEFRFLHDERRFRVGVSIGVVAVDNRWKSLNSLLLAADTACYAAKEAGRNRVHAWFDTDAVLRLRQGEMHWVNRLEQAMEDNQLVLFGQRIAPLGAGQHGLHCEVLLRLQNPDGTLALPSLFVAAAERFHLATRIDRWVVRSVLQQLDALAGRSGDIEMVSINLSGQSIGDRDFHRDLSQLLRRSRFDLHKLCLEITETAAITNLVEARRFIEEARNLGVRIALDDFGAGASSFGYLKTLPVDLIKIDGQFITDLLEDPLDNAAVRCFRDVAQVVGVRTVAEFVERPAVLARVRELGIDYAQGYLIHRPEPLANLLAQTGSRADLVGPRAALRGLPGAE